MGVSKNMFFYPKSSILIGFSIINHPFWGTPIFGNTHMNVWFLDDFSPSVSSGVNPIKCSDFSFNLPMSAVNKSHG